MIITIIAFTKSQTKSLMIFSQEIGLSTPNNIRREKNDLPTELDRPS